MSNYNKPFDLTSVREAVANTNSWRSLALYLKLPYPSSVIYRRLRPFCGQHAIDVSHFTGQASNRGKTFDERRRDIQVYLSNEQPIASHALKIRLLDEGLKRHQCEKCDRTEWNGRPIPIQLHHEDGNSANNQLDNLKILCPNCHAQTGNYCAKNRKDKTLIPPMVPDNELAKYIPLSTNPAQVLRVVGLSLAQANYDRINRLTLERHLSFKPRSPNKRVKGDPYWRIKPKPEQRKFSRPGRDELERMVWEKPTAQIAKQIGCSDNAITKWCQQYGINKPPRGYWAKMAASRRIELRS